MLTAASIRKGADDMDLRDLVAERVEREFGVDALVDRWLVDREDRCVAEVLRADGRRVAVKAEVDVRHVEREVKVLRAAREGRVPVPAVLASWEEGPAGFVSEWVEGDWLAPGKPERAWSNAGDALRRLHDLDVPELSFYQDAASWSAGMGVWFVHTRAASNAIPVAPAAVEAIAGALRRVLAEPDIPVRTLHVDCGPIHWRLDEADDVVGLLDLGEVMRGDPVYDLAVLTLRDPGRLTAVLDGYRADPSLRRWVDQALPAYRAFRHLADTVWLVEHGYDPAIALAEVDAAVAALP